MKNKVARRVCWLVIGCIDHTGAVLTRKVYDDERSYPDHSTLWPKVTHKRFRFIVRDWDIQVFGGNSRQMLTDEDFEAIDSRMRKILPLPLWVQKNDAWENAGRPYGRKGDKFNERWEAAHPAAREALALGSTTQ